MRSTRSAEREVPSPEIPRACAIALSTRRVASHLLLEHATSTPDAGMEVMSMIQYGHWLMTSSEAQEVPQVVLVRSSFMNLLTLFFF